MSDAKEPKAKPEPKPKSYTCQIACVREGKKYAKGESCSTVDDLSNSRFWKAK